MHCIPLVGSRQIISPDAVALHHCITLSLTAVDAQTQQTCSWETVYGDQRQTCYSSDCSSTRNEPTLRKCY